MPIRFPLQSQAHREFSSFAPFAIERDGARVLEPYGPPPEFADPPRRRPIREAAKPAIAKRLAGKPKAAIPPVCDQLRDGAMYRPLSRKFALHRELGELWLVTPEIAGAAAGERYRGIARQGAARNSAELRACAGKER